MKLLLRRQFEEEKVEDMFKGDPIEFRYLDISDSGSLGFFNHFESQDKLTNTFSMKVIIVPVNTCI